MTGKDNIPPKFFRLIGFGRDVVSVGCIDKLEVGTWGMAKVAGVPDDEEYEV